MNADWRAIAHQQRDLKEQQSCAGQQRQREYGAPDQLMSDAPAPHVPGDADRERDNADRGTISAAEPAGITDGISEL